MPVLPACMDDSCCCVKMKIIEFDMVIGCNKYFSDNRVFMRLAFLFESGELRRENGRRGKGSGEMSQLMSTRSARSCV